MSIKKLLKLIFKIKRYCPKCGTQMERITVKSNFEAINGSDEFMQCPNCKSILYTP